MHKTSLEQMPPEGPALDWLTATNQRERTLLEPLATWFIQARSFALENYCGQEVKSPSFRFSVNY